MTETAHPIGHACSLCGQPLVMATATTPGGPYRRALHLDPGSDAACAALRRPGPE